MKVYSIVGLVGAASLTYFSLGLFETPPLPTTPEPTEKVDTGVSEIPMTSPDQGKVIWGKWKPIADELYFQHRLANGMIPSDFIVRIVEKTDDDGVCQLTEHWVQKDSLEQIFIKPAEHRGHVVGWIGSEAVTDRPPVWNYRIPTYPMPGFIGRSPMLKYELNGKTFVRHFSRNRKNLGSSGDLQLLDALTAAEDLVVTHGCRKISLMFGISSSAFSFNNHWQKAWVFVDDWKYFAVPAKYRPVDPIELRELIRSGTGSVYLHELKLSELKRIMETDPVLVTEIPTEERSLYYNIDKLVMKDFNLLKIQTSINGLISHFEIQDFQHYYSSKYGMDNLLLAVNNLHDLGYENIRSLAPFPPIDPSRIPHSTANPPWPPTD